MRPVLFFYCQHSMGLGHLVRSWAIADALSSSFRVVFVTGGEVPGGLDAPARIEVVTLPPLQQTAAGEILTRDGDRAVAGTQARRRSQLLDTFDAADPDVIVIELFPFGRAKFADEILPVLESARTRRPRPLIVCSLRDILAGGRKNQQQHDDRARLLADNYFDAVLVHADPRLATLDETFKPATPLKIPVLHTGFVTAASATATSDAGERSGILVSAGGGRVGGPLFRAAVAAHALSSPDDRMPMRIVAGPFLPDDEFAALARCAGEHERLTVERSVPSLSPLLARAAISVSQCGYNTALELIQAGVPSLVVPFAEGREDEQRARARRLERLGAVRVLDPGELTAPRLAEALAGMRGVVPDRLALDTGGARATLDAIVELRQALSREQSRQRCAS